jgi:hypothetical protein
MLAFVIGDFLRRRKRPRPRVQRDEMPVRGLLEFVAFAMLLLMGGLSGALALIGAFLLLFTDTPRDATIVSIELAFTVISPICFFLAVMLWWRLTRD